MTATPGTPDDWTDTNPESTAPERILPTPEDVTPSATKVAMVCYAVGAASKCWEHPERAGVFDSDRASQIVTELCVALGMEQQGDTAPESARAATLTPEQPVKAPGQGGDLLLTRGKPVEVAPEPVDPDAELVECMAKEVHDRNCADVSCRDWDGHGESTRKAWRDDARFVIRNLRAQGFDVTPRAEQ